MAVEVAEPTVIPFRAKFTPSLWPKPWPLTWKVPSIATHGLDRVITGAEELGRIVNEDREVVGWDCSGEMSATPSLSTALANTSSPIPAWVVGTVIDQLVLDCPGVASVVLLG